MKNKALVGLVSGVGLVIATLIGVALLNMPSAESAVAPAQVSKASCGPAGDQGYGVAKAVKDCHSID